MLSWKEGQHYYISLASGASHPLRSRNPFTVASVCEDREMVLVARIHDGNTAALARAASTEDAKTVPLTLEGPYGLTTHSTTLLSYTRVLFLAGGVGATFVIPLYRTLLRDLSPSPGSRRRQNVKFVWAVRDVSETSWAVTGVEAEDRGMRERMRVFVTGTREEMQEGGKGVEDEDEGVEMERLLPAGGGEEVKSGTGWDVRHGRPDVGRLIDETLQRTLEDESVAIIVCGPKSLAEEVRRKTGKWVGKRDVWLHVEAFGL